MLHQHSVGCSPYTANIGTNGCMTRRKDLTNESHDLHCLGKGGLAVGFVKVLIIPRVDDATSALARAVPHGYSTLNIGINNLKSNCYGV